MSKHHQAGWLSTICAIALGLALAVPGAACHKDGQDTASTWNADTEASEFVVPREEPTPEPVFEPTDVARVLAGEHRVGTRVRFDVVVLGKHIIQNNENDRVSHFVLAVPAGSPYLASLEEMATELERLRKRFDKQRKKLAKKPARLKKFTEEFLAVNDRMDKLQPHAGQFIAIELAGEVPELEWQVVWQDEPSPGDRPWSNEPGSLGPPGDSFTYPGTTSWNPSAPYMPRFTTPNFYFDMESVESRLEQLAGYVPPDPGEDMPNLESVWVNQFDAGEVRRYNRAVARYNREVNRRRHYIVQLMDRTLRVRRAYLDDVLAAKPITVTAEVVHSRPNANRTFEQAAGVVPTTYVLEQPQGQTVAERIFTTRDLLITSYPDGAWVIMNDERVGKTPYLVPDVPANQTVAFELSLKKHESRTEELTMTAMGDEAHVFEAVMRSKKRRRK